MVEQTELSEAKEEDEQPQNTLKTCMGTSSGPLLYLCTYAEHLPVRSENRARYLESHDSSLTDPQNGLVCTDVTLYLRENGNSDPLLFMCVK